MIDDITQFAAGVILALVILYLIYWERDRRRARKRQVEEARRRLDSRGPTDT